MRERVMINASIFAALGVLALGVGLRWNLVPVVYSALGTLVLGLAAARLVAFIAARLHQKGDS